MCTLLRTLTMHVRFYLIFLTEIIFPNKNEKFYKRYVSVSREYVESLETISSAEIAAV